MNILMLNHEFPPIGGGGGYAGRNILRHLAGRDDLRIDVIVSRAEPGLVIEPFADNITLYRVGVHKKALQFWSRWEMIEWTRKAYRVHRRLVDGNRYDLAHAFFGFPAGLLAWRTASRLPYIVSFRGSDVPGANARFRIDYKFLGPLFRRIWRGAAGLYACSEGLRDRALLFCDDVEISVVPNGVEIARFCPPAEPRAPVPLRLLSVGRLSASKRIPLVIDAAMLLRQRFGDLTLTLAGGGGLRPEIEQLIADRGAEGFIKLLGVVPADRMPLLYREHNVFVTATASEGMSNAMLEAMAAGLPIVTTECEGVPELIGDNGVVVKEPSAQALAGAVVSVVASPDVYLRYAAAARRRAETFGWQQTAESYVECYRRICGVEPAT